MDKRIQAQMAKMDQQQELLLARLLTEEAQQLTERAKSTPVCLLSLTACTVSHQPARGVTAYLERPTKRLRPNQRFLQNTLGNINSGTCTPPCSRTTSAPRHSKQARRGGRALGATVPATSTRGQTSQRPPPPHAAVPKPPSHLQQSRGLPG